MVQQSITVTHLTPAMGQLLSANAVTLIPFLKAAFFVGDILTKRDVLRLQALAPNVSIINMYGTTETQRAVSYFTIPPSPAFTSTLKEVMPAGKGMEGVQLILVNQQRQLCGIGEVGEIFVRSFCLSEGYLGLEQATNEKFVLNWFSNSFNHSVNIESKQSKQNEFNFYKGKRDRLYKTGDLGRYRPDGQGIRLLSTSGMHWESR
jgi:L-aminoadipate-semialdehyde dehydrogenase